MPWILRIDLRNLLESSQGHPEHLRVPSPHFEDYSLLVYLHLNRLIKKKKLLCPGLSSVDLTEGMII